MTSAVPPPVEEPVLDVTALAAGGDGVARDANGRVTFVPRTVPGDRVRARVTKATTSFARAVLLEVIAPSPDRVAPACEAFERGCGGCAWLHVARTVQLDAKQALVANALRKLDGLAIERIADPCPPLGWRRRARFHVANGVLGLYREGTHDIVPIEHCPQLEPELDAQLAAIDRGRDGEVAIVRGHANEIAIRHASDTGGATVELEPGLRAGPWDFAQASAAGNAALIALARGALGPGPGALLELYAGGGNLTRGFVDDDWTVTASDVAKPPQSHGARFELGQTAAVLDRLAKRERVAFEAIVLDPPRTGAADAIPGIARLAPRTIVYVSCDPATLARDRACRGRGAARASVTVARARRR